MAGTLSFADVELEVYHKAHDFDDLHSCNFLYFWNVCLQIHLIFGCPPLSLAKKFFTFPPSLSGVALQGRRLVVKDNKKRERVWFPIFFKAFTGL